MVETKSKARSRGGQPGNTNAIKSGFYSAHFKKLELDDLTTIDGSLDDEIAMMRVINRRVFEFANNNEPVDLESWSKLLSTLGASNVRLAALIRTKMLVEGKGNSSDSLISLALADVMKGYGYGDK